MREKKRQGDEGMRRKYEKKYPRRWRKKEMKAKGKDEEIRE